MKFLKLLFYSSVFFLFSFISCKSLHSDKSVSSSLQSFDTEHNSRNSLDWAGTYRGNFPCDNCDSEEIIIKIKTDGKFVKTKKKIGKTDPVVISSGKFSWNERGNEITLHEQSEESYLVGEGRLLKSEGKDTQAFQHASENDFLIKEDFSITETYWKLTQLNQKPVDFHEKELHVIFKSDGMVKGFGGCNPFTAQYQISETENLNLDDIDIQEISCSVYHTEDEFLKVLQSVKSYDILGDVLFFLDANGRQTARFDAVYFN